MVLIIRHAEKAAPTVGDKDPKNLSERGYERADALAESGPRSFPQAGFPDRHREVEEQQPSRGDDHSACQLSA